MEPSSLAQLRNWVVQIYPIAEPVDLSLLRSYTNDVFLVTSPWQRSVLKVYGAGWRTADEIQYEIALLRHLAARGIAVAEPISGRDGQALHRAVIGGTARHAVLFTYLAGAKPTPPFTPDLYVVEGRAAAALHNAGDDFSSDFQRPALDLTYLLDRPLALMLPLLGRDEAASFASFVGRLRAEIAALAAGLDWGPCHGDLTLDNLHVTPDGGIAWYDFDSGGPGWRAMDLPGWAAFDPAYAPLRDAFLRGYRAVRPLSQNDIAAMPYLAVAVEIWGFEIDLRRRVMAQGEDAVRRYLATALSKVRSWSEHSRFDP